MKNRLFLIGVFLLGSLATAAEIIHSQDLIGSWELESFVITQSNGTTYNWGGGSKGHLIYTDEGTMSVSIMGKKKDSKLSYSGTYEVRDGNKVVHKVTKASDADRVGKEMVRYAELKENTLTLISKGDEASARLVWRRR